MAPANRERTGIFFSIINAYYWNSRFVFRSEARRTFPEHLNAFLKSLLSYGLTSYAVGAALLEFWVWCLPRLFGISVSAAEGIGPVINLCVTIPLNFILNKYWAFRGSKGTKKAGKDAIE